MSKPILDEAQYNNFFRNLAEIVHTDLPTIADKRKALLDLIQEDGSNGDVDLANLAEFVSWFDDAIVEAV